MAMAERGTTPFPEVGRALAGAGGRDPAGALYLAILPRVGGLLADPDRYRFLWEPEWARVEADAALIDAGGATVEDHPGADLAIVRAPRPLHDMAVHPRADSMRVLTALPDGTLTLRHRYETWVDYASRPLPARVDLAPLLPRPAGAGARAGDLALRRRRAHPPPAVPLGRARARVAVVPGRRAPGRPAGPRPARGGAGKLDGRQASTRGRGERGRGTTARAAAAAVGRQHAQEPHRRGAGRPAPARATRSALAVAREAGLDDAVVFAQRRLDALDRD